MSTEQESSLELEFQEPDMSMTPNEIRNAEFGTSMRGFNREEVDQFMQKTATALEASLTETADLQERFDKLQVKYDKLVAMEDTLKSTLLEAQKTADTMRANAEKDVQLSLERARGKQEIIEEQARQQTVLLQDKVNELDKIRLDYQEKIQQTISSHMKLIEDISFSAEFPIDVERIVENQTTDFEQSELEQTVLEPAEIEEVTLFESVVEETSKTEENPSLHAALTDLAERDAEPVQEELAEPSTSEPSTSEAIAQAVESKLPSDDATDDSLYKKLATDDTEAETHGNSETDTAEEAQKETVAEDKKPKSNSALESGADGIVVFGRKEDREKAVEENARILSELDSVVDKFAEELREIDSK